MPNPYAAGISTNTGDIFYPQGSPSVTKTIATKSVASPGSYQGVVIKGGTDADVAKQIADIDAAKKKASEGTIISSVQGEKLNNGTKDFVQTEQNNISTAKVPKVPTGKTDAELMADLQNTPKSQAQQDADQANQDVLDSYDALILGNNADTQALKDQLKQFHDDSYKQLQDLNKQTGALQQRAELRSGEARYSPQISTDFLASSARAGLQKLQDLDTKYITAVAAADAALRSGNAKVAFDKAKFAKDIKDQALTEFNKQLADAKTLNQTIQNNAIQSSRDTAIAGLVSQGVTDPKQLLNYLNFDDQGNVTGDFSAEEVGKTLKNLAPEGELSKLSGAIGEYYSLIKHDPTGSILPASILALPENQRPYAYVQYKATLGRKPTTGGSTTYSFSNVNNGRLLSSGLTPAQITHLEEGINQYGLAEVLNKETGLTEEQKDAIRSIVAGSEETGP